MYQQIVTNYTVIGLFLFFIIKVLLNELVCVIVYTPTK